ncbi:MAG: DUF262 domain-containing protein [Candidatus Cloacimonetes bacterium]|nr:DUF262 domain-containing protein [Candidatus Cloacimonadota bacterium]
MEIKLKEIPIREVIKNYVNNNEEGVVGFDGKLNIRPKYQREFVYNDKQRDEVINTIKNNFPLNVMYWAKNADDTYEVLDGQQRTISFCEYVVGNFSLNNLAFHNLTDVEQNQILDYKLMIYICTGNDKEKLDWFKIINIAGVQLADQELRNAIYTGEWLTEAKRYFSKNNCPAYNIASDYLNGSPIRQDYLEKALEWINDGKIEDYMSKHQHDQNANELWLYFQSVINWVRLTFVKYRKEMKGVNWGKLYNQFKDVKFDTNKLEEEVSKLMQDNDVTKKSGIYEYILTRDEKTLSIRAFDDNMKREAYERQTGICVKCEQQFDIENMAADHIIAWSKGGKTTAENCQMLCTRCNAVKSNH